LIGLAKATHITTTGATYLASDPLVNSLFSKLLETPQDTLAYAVELATEIAENTSLNSTKMMRDLLLYNSDTPEEMHVLDSRSFISAVGSKDNVAGIKGFMNKTKPDFTGAFDPESVPFWPWWKPRNSNHVNTKL
jgi:enoyl-CoA hydratase/carnithine racemase